MKTLQMKSKSLRLFVPATFVALLASAGTLSVVPSTAYAQTNDSVTVDLSVLNDGGQMAYMPSDPASRQSGGIMMPPKSGPVSRFYFGGDGSDSSSGLKLKKPGTTNKVSSIRKARENKAETKVAKTMAPAPAALVKAPKPPMIATAPAPKPAKPAEPVVMASSGATPPPPPPPSAMPEMAKAPEPVKEVATEPTPLAVKMPPPPPPAAAPEMKKAVEPVAPAAEVASTTPIASTPSKPGDSLLIPFDANDAKLPTQLKTHLADLADSIRDDKDIRLQLMAYAGGDSISAGKARRMSLSRALSVRSFLIENGIRSTRIDVRALGNKTTTDPINRVDVNISKR